MSYYERGTTMHVDGTPMFKTPEDEKSEEFVAAAMETAWSCQAHSFGRLSPIDWWLERDGRVVGVAELKTRQHDSERYPTVFLNVRKWLALTLASTGMGVPAVFVVRWNDETRWIPIAEVDASKTQIGGTREIVKARSDIEPVILVPVGDMRPL